MHRTVTEAALAALRDEVVDAMMERDVYQFIQQKIQNLGMEANIHFKTPRSRTPNYSAWTITSDNSIQKNTSSMDPSPLSKRARRVGVELISPTFVFGDFEWTKEIKILFASLNEMHWKPNRSTGLHVHVGLNGKKIHSRGSEAAGEVHSGV